MNNKNISVALVVVAIIAIGGVFFPQVQTEVREVFSGSAGPEHTEFQSFLASSQTCSPGGVRATSTVNSAETLLAADLENTCQIDYTLNVQAATLTFPASSTMKHILPQSGMSRTWYIRNATTTATNLTIAGGAGTLLKQATTTDAAGTKVIFGDTDGSNTGRVTLIRKPNSDFTLLFEAFRD